MFKLHTNTLATIKIIVIGLLLANMTIVNAQGSTFDILHTPTEAKGPGIKITFNGSKYEPAKEIKIRINNETFCS